MPLRWKESRKTINPLWNSHKNFTATSIAPLWKISITKMIKIVETNTWIYIMIDSTGLNIHLFHFFLHDISTKSSRGRKVLLMKFWIIWEKATRHRISVLRLSSVGDDSKWLDHRLPSNFPRVESLLNFVANFRIDGTIVTCYCQRWTFQLGPSW